MKCVIKQRSEYVINRYVINPTGEKKKRKKKKGQTSWDGAVWL